MDAEFPQQLPAPPPPSGPAAVPHPSAVPVAYPSAAPVFTPPVHTKGASKAKNVVLGLLAAFILLPIVAIFALLTLGTTVEENFTEIPNASGGETSQFDSAEAPALAFGDVPVPADSPVYVDASGAFTMAVDPSWPSAEVQPNPITGFDMTFWSLCEYSSSNAVANVNVSYSPTPWGATLDSMAQAEIDLTRSVVDVTDVQQFDRVVDGVAFKEIEMVASVEGVELVFYLVMRLDDGVVRAATLTTPIETAAEARLDVLPYLRTLHVSGTTS